MNIFPGPNSPPSQDPTSQSSPESPESGALSVLDNKNPIDIIFPEAGVVGSASLLDSHFGIVPGVITGEWMMQNRGGVPIHDYTRKYIQPISPGMNIVKGIDNGVVMVQGEKPGEERKILAQMEFNTKPINYTTHPIPDDAEVILAHNGSDWIPHGDKFRFCDRVGHQGDILVGRYTVKNTYITEDGTIPFWQIEEACAQMMLGSYRAKKGENAPYETYAEAKTKGAESFKYQMSQLRPRDTITCVGEANDITDDKGRVKQINFIYTCFVNGAPLFQGNIIGNAISMRVWERQFKNP